MRSTWAISHHRRGARGEPGSPDRLIHRPLIFPSRRIIMGRMVLSKRVARFNRVATNQVLKHVAGWAPGFAMVVHKGRKSGREFRTPVNVFRSKDGFVVALTYGPGADWVK